MKLKTLLLTALPLAMATPAAAWQIPAPAASQETVAPVSAPAAPLSGPRVRSQFRPVEARLTSDREPATYKKSSETITVSTLVLVLVIVILVLLIV